MRPIYTASLEKSRPVLVLTRELLWPHMNRVSVAPITTHVRGLSTEVAVGPPNGLDAVCVVTCDNIATVSVESLGRQIGVLLAEQELALSEAIRAAFDLD